MGYPVELIDADTESKPEVARTQAEKLIRDGAQILVGAFDMRRRPAAIAQVAEQNGVPFVINIGADPAITEQGYKFVFRNFPDQRRCSATNGLAPLQRPVQGDRRDAEDGGAHASSTTLSARPC